MAVIPVKTAVLSAGTQFSGRSQQLHPMTEFTLRHRFRTWGRELSWILLMQQILKAQSFLCTRSRRVHSHRRYSRRSLTFPACCLSLYSFLSSREYFSTTLGLSILKPGGARICAGIQPISSQPLSDNRCAVSING